MEFIEALEVPPLLFAVHCTRKSRNLGTLVRTASACNAQMLLIIGENKVGFHGAFGSNTRISILHFNTWPEAISFLRNKRNAVHFYGVSPPGQENGGCVSLKSCAFPRLLEGESACFVVGARGEPLSAEILQFLDIEIKVDFPVPKYARMLQFEEVFAVAIHNYVSFMRAEDGTKVFTPHEWKGEKYVKGETSLLRQSSHRGLSISQILERSKRVEKAAEIEDSVLGGLGALLTGVDVAEKKNAEADY